MVRNRKLLFCTWWSISFAFIALQWVSFITVALVRAQCISTSVFAVPSLRCLTFINISAYNLILAIHTVFKSRYTMTHVAAMGVEAYWSIWIATVQASFTLIQINALRRYPWPLSIFLTFSYTLSCHYITRIAFIPGNTVVSGALYVDMTILWFCNLRTAYHFTGWLRAWPQSIRLTNSSRMSIDCVPWVAGVMNCVSFSGARVGPYPVWNRSRMTTGCYTASIMRLESKAAPLLADKFALVASLISSQCYIVVHSTVTSPPIKPATPIVCYLWSPRRWYITASILSSDITLIITKPIMGLILRAGIFWACCADACINYCHCWHQHQTKGNG